MPKHDPIRLAFSSTGRVLVHAELLYGEGSARALLNRAAQDGREVVVGVEVDASEGQLTKAIEDAAAEAVARGAAARKKRKLARKKPRSKTPRSSETRKEPNTNGRKAK